MKTIEQMTKEIDDMLVSLNSINLEPTLLDLNYETENQDECCCEQQQLSYIQES